MRSPFLYTLIFCVMFSSLNAQQASEASQKIDLLLRKYYEQKQFNGTVLVAKAGEVLFQKAYGYADMEKKIPNRIETPFLIGSTTKSFTAIAMMQLWEKGLVDLHQPIITYLPDLNEELGALTLHQLMKNTSGLPVHLNRVTNLEYRDITSEELLMLYRGLSLSFEPGTKFEYSNLNYQLCALVLERVSGQSYKSYVEQHILLPSSMSNSGIERTRLTAKNKAVGYDLENGHFTKAQRNYMAFARGGGDMYATAPDLLKWDQALYGPGLVSPAAKILLFDGDPEVFGGYGYGFKVKNYTRKAGEKQGKLVRHGGSMYGYICNVHRYLEDRVTIIILGNIRPYPTMEITVAIESILLGTGYF